MSKPSHRVSPSAPAPSSPSSSRRRRRLASPRLA
eukprot:CAMPEP_0179697016 /NCGR_PEP_ID=MMETSP0936-20121108/7170_1 /TAXON_ID=548131 ORGANISM="Ostreococcus mediterraneus, Strain clade-D-RCC2573" /NCGR_SAMPLE_ID=MMETSP0936 /ASSEMBLY_ACC=CAM_ASM_000574 /LENGTH=33 /DNA_ID= /DNA_START= /DNA_END= /DNA_ORIENTATION=